MKLSLLAFLALPAAATAIDWPKFRGSVTVLADMEGDGCQPSYCYDACEFDLCILDEDEGGDNWMDNIDDDRPWDAVPDDDCYASGYPKCCCKNKGTCPLGHLPPCEPVEEDENEEASQAN